MGNLDMNVGAIRVQYNDSSSGFLRAPRVTIGAVKIPVVRQIVAPFGFFYCRLILRQAKDAR